MSRFLCPAVSGLAPYTPGEQPRDMRYIKLNTNESPFPPSPKVVEALNEEERQKLRLYSDPTCKDLVDAIAKRYGLTPEQVLPGNGSDENLAFAFRAFCDDSRGPAYADITYGFYKVWAKLWELKPTVVPLREDFSLHVDDYMDLNATIFIANPNAPTGMTVPVEDIRRLLAHDRDRVVVVDEAYVDFGAESCVPLLKEFDNLLVVQTFSKSRSLAGARLGFSLGSPELISDLNRIKYSFNPYNINRLSILAGKAAMEDEDYFRTCTGAIQTTRAWTVEALTNLGFQVLPSQSNFIFARTDKCKGEMLYKGLKERGILVRWFDADRIRDFVRITIGAQEDMETLVATVSDLLEV